MSAARQAFGSPRLRQAFSSRTAAASFTFFHIEELYNATGNRHPLSTTIVKYAAPVHRWLHFIVENVLKHSDHTPGQNGPGLLVH